MLGIRLCSVLILLAGLAPAALADNPSPDKADIAETGDSAATVPGDPALLFHIARLQEKLGRSAEAHAYFEEYLQKHPLGPHAASAKERLAALRDEVQGALVVDSNPQGATVFLNSEPVGRTPLRAILAAGEHTVELRMGSRTPIRRVIRAAAGKQVTLNMAFAAAESEQEAAPTHAGRSPTLSLKTAIGGAHFTVDGIFVGTTAANGGKRKHPLSRGMHRIVVSRPGNHSWKARILANPGDDLNLSLRLGHSQSPMAKIAAWSAGGIGAAFVVGGLGTGVGAMFDDNDDLARSADIMIVGGLSAVVLGGFIHWVTRDTPTSVDLTRKRQP